MSRGADRKIQRLNRQIVRLEERSKSLEDRADMVSKQINATSNLADRKGLDEQLKNFYEEMRLIEQEIDEREEERDLLQASSASSNTLSNNTINAFTNLQKIFDILCPYEPELKLILPEVIEFCLPTGWKRAFPTHLKGIILELDDIQPDANNWQALTKLAALLIIHPKTPPNLCQTLLNWGEQQTHNFEFVRLQMKTKLTEKLEAKNQSCAYLMMVVEETHTNSKRYWVNGYLISDAKRYRQNPSESYETLRSCIKGKTDYSGTELAQLAKGYLEQCEHKSINHLIIEIFIPLSLIQLAVESWERKSFNPDFTMRIGCDYQVYIRSTERLKRYDSVHRKRWKDKWQKLTKQLNVQATDLVRDIDEPTIDGPKDYSNLLAILNDVGAFKLKKAPKSTDFFNAVLDMANPIGLWLRRDLHPPAYQTTELNSLLKCCLRELPYQVQAKRAETRLQENYAEDSHIGHHLVLLWEDPHRLPPNELEFEPAL